MSLPYTRPGVAINVVGTPSIPGSGATGGLGAIIGTAPKGYGGANPLIYTSMADVIRDYGDPAVYGYPTWTIPLAAQLYFSQAGIGTGLRPGLLIERIGASAASGSLIGTGTSLAVTAQPPYAGTAGNAIAVTFGAVAGNAQPVTVVDGQGRSETYSIADSTGGSLAATILAGLLGSSAILVPGAAVNSGFFTVGTVTLGGGTDGQGTAIAQAHFDALSSYQVEGVCPLDGLQATAILAQTHADTMSASFNKPRVAFVGPAQGTVVATITTNATAIADQQGRVVYAGHDSIKVVNPAVQSSIQTVPGFFLAAALMGDKFANAVFEPLTYKPVLGIAGPGTILTQSQLDSLAAVGCTVLDNLGGWVVRDSLTTAEGSYANPYVHLVNRTSEDEFANRIRQWALSQFIGKPNDRDVVTRIQSGISGVAAQAIRDRVIQGIGAITPSQGTSGAWTAGVQYAQTGETDYLTVNLTVTQ